MASPPPASRLSKAEFCDTRLGIFGHDYGPLLKDLEAGSILIIRPCNCYDAKEDKYSQRPFMFPNGKIDPDRPYRIFVESENYNCGVQIEEEMAVMFLQAIYSDEEWAIRVLWDSRPHILWTPDIDMTIARRYNADSQIPRSQGS